MSIVRQLPLRQKLTWLAMTCSVVALLVAAAALGTYEWRFYRRTMVTHLTTLANVTARNSVAAAAFANADDANRMLAALESEPAVVAAVLYDAHGRRLAQFNRPGAGVDRTWLLPPPEDGARLEGLGFRLSVPVAESKRFGTLVVVADLSSVQIRIEGYAVVLLLTTLLSGLLAYLLTGWLAQRIVAPIEALGAAAARVQTGGDYTVGVPKEADDEVGALTDAFNAMLARIHHHETEIARGAERLRLAVEAARIGTWDWDIERDYAIWNARMYEMFNVPPGTSVTIDVFLQRVHPDDRERVRQRLDAAMNASADFVMEFRVVGDSPADVRYLTSRGQFLAGSGATAQRAIGVTVDLTERRTAELRAIENEQRFRTVAERTPAMIWSCDAALNRDYFNRTWLSFTGRSLEHEVGQGWQLGVPRADLEHWRMVTSAAARRREPYTVEYRLRRADGTLRWVVETGAQRFAADGSFAGYFGSCIDITMRKENEAELAAHVRLRTRELEIANQELESFSYSVSHDLRAPVRAIQGFTEIALEELASGNSESARERLERVVRAAERMNKLIDAFIAMARVSRAELTIEPVNLSKLAEDVAGFLRASQPSRDVRIAIAPNLVARGDERLLRIVMENLLGNAWKFTSRQPNAEIVVGGSEDGQAPYFVRDNGAGFDPALAHKLFQAFERLHPGSQFEGLGVGLSTVQRIVEKHGGRIWAESQPGEGATFFFTLGPGAPVTGGQANA